MNHIMPVVFSDHVRVQLEVKCSLVRLCQGNNEQDLVEMTWPTKQAGKQKHDTTKQSPHFSFNK